MRRALAVTALVFACRKAPPPPPPARPAPDAAAAPRDATPPAPDVPAAPPDAPSPDDAAPDAPAGIATREAGDLRGDDHVDAIVAAPGGAVHVQAINREGRRASDLVATPLDADGLPRGPARLLRRTSGPITALDASVGGDALWVAWGAVRPLGAEGDGPRRGEFIVAALRASLDLATVGRPVTVEDFRAFVGEPGDMEPQAIPRLSVGVVAADDGGAHLVASSPMQTCTHEAGTDHASRAPCRAWGHTAITADGRRARDATGVLAMTEGPYALLRVPGGYAFAVGDDHIGSKTSLFGEALGAAAAPFATDTHWHYRDVAFAAAGGAVYVRGQPTEEGMAGREHGAILALDRAHAPTTPVRRAASGDEWPPLARVALRCADGRPTVALRWAGGAATLDPGAPGTSFRWEDWIAPDALPRPAGLAADVDPPHALAWAGRALVGVVGDARVRWRCGANGAPALARDDRP